MMGVVGSGTMSTTLAHLTVIWSSCTATTAKHDTAFDRVLTVLLLILLLLLLMLRLLLRSCARRVILRRPCIVY